MTLQESEVVRNKKQESKGTLPCHIVNVAWGIEKNKGDVRRKEDGLNLGICHFFPKNYSMVDGCHGYCMGQKYQMGIEDTTPEERLTPPLRG